MGYHLLDSGALYRLTALSATKQGVELADVDGVARVARELDARFDSNADGSERIWLDNVDVTLEIRRETSGEMASVVAVEQSGRRIGREVDLTAKEALPFLQSFRTDILPVFEDFSKAGDHLAKAIFRSIDHPELPPIQELDVPTMTAG